MQQLGIYRYYNLQHLNSGPASNIISNQVTFIFTRLLLLLFHLKTFTTFRINKH
ncbi:unnamed protein product [Brassica rapa subsp. trilocularis]